MKTTAGGCFDHARCDLCDYEVKDGHVQPINHGKTEEERHFSEEGYGRCIQPQRVRDC